MGLGQLASSQTKSLESKASLSSEQQHGREVSVASREVDALGKRTDQKVDVVLPQHLPALQQKPEFLDQGGWKVIKGPKNKDKMASAVVSLQVIATPNPDSRE